MDGKTVEPLRNKKEIEKLKKITYASPRDHLLLVMGLNNGLRIRDLLALKAGDVRGLKTDQVLHIREQKTGKPTHLQRLDRAKRKALKSRGNRKIRAMPVID